MNLNEVMYLIFVHYNSSYFISIMGNPLSFLLVLFFFSISNERYKKYFFENLQSNIAITKVNAALSHRIHRSDHKNVNNRHLVVP